MFFREYRKKSVDGQGLGVEERETMNRKFILEKVNLTLAFGW
jgi:hypothetical protein